LGFTAPNFWVKLFEMFEVNSLNSSAPNTSPCNTTCNTF